MEETLDTIKHIKIYQKKKGYRFSIDAVILGSFIQGKAYQNAIELGAGSGVVSILIAEKLKHTTLTTVEIQDDLVRLARKNIDLNNLTHQIHVIHEDIKRLPAIFKSGEFDLVLSNPPFRKKNTGFVSPNSEKSIARHEIMINLDSLIKITAFLLKNRGTSVMVYHPFRLSELMHLLEKYRLEPKRMQFIHDRLNEEASMVLIESIKGSGKWLRVEPPLFVHDEKGNYSEVMKDIFR